MYNNLSASERLFVFIGDKAVSPSMSFYESHRRRPIYYSGPPQDSRLFYKKPRDLLVEGGHPGAVAATSVP